MGSGAKFEQYVVNCRESEKRDRDWQISSAIEAGFLPGALIPGIKKKVDYRKGNDWWEIGNQGLAGSCVAWAVADSVLRWHFVKEGWIDDNEKISVRYLWMAAKETDEFTDRPTTFVQKSGTSLKTALGIAYKYGVVLESELPSNSGELFNGTEEDFYTLASKRRISSYYNLGNKLDDWRTWIALQGPLAARLNIDDAWRNCNRRNPLLDEYREGGGGHACALVGFTPEHFIVRNSWGKKWGEGGYAYVSNRYAEKAFTEVYGIVLSWE